MNNERIIIGEQLPCGAPIDAPIIKPPTLDQPNYPVQHYPPPKHMQIRWRKTEHPFILEQYDANTGAWNEVPCLIP